jgi:hypothetical protein
MVIHKCRANSIRSLWRAHAEIRSGGVSDLLGTETSAAVAETAKVLEETGRREGQNELRPTSSPARNLNCELPPHPKG